MLGLLRADSSFPSDMKLPFNNMVLPLHEVSLSNLKLESRKLASSLAAVHQVCLPEPESYTRNQETGYPDY